MAPPDQQPADDAQEKRRCLDCGQTLARRGGIWACRACNPEEFDQPDIFDDDTGSGDYVLIECPGATLYAPDSNEVVAGVKWSDNDDPTKGHRIIKHPVYAPNHTRRRRVKREAVGRIRRCQACQDLTVRLRRKEGADFFIPSSRHPGRKKLKSVQYVTRAPS